MKTGGHLHVPLAWPTRRYVHWHPVNLKIEV